MQDKHVTTQQEGGHYKVVYQHGPAKNRIELTAEEWLPPEIDVEQRMLERADSLVATARRLTRKREKKQQRGDKTGEDTSKQRKDW